MLIPLKRWSPWIASGPGCTNWELVCFFVHREIQSAILSSRILALLYQRNDLRNLAASSLLQGCSCKETWFYEHKSIVLLQVRWIHVQGNRSCSQRWARHILHPYILQISAVIDICKTVTDIDAVISRRSSL